MLQEVLSTSILKETAERHRRELADQSCTFKDEPGDRVRVTWPDRTMLDTITGEYVLPSGLRLRLEARRAR